MTNIIEIRVQTINETAAGLQEAEADAKAAAQNIAAVLEEGGGEAGDGFTTAFAAALEDRLGEGAGGAGEEVSAALTEAVSGAGDAMATEIGSSLTEGLAESAGRLGELGESGGEQFGAGIREGATAAVAELAETVEEAGGLLGSDLMEMISAGVRSSSPELNAAAQSLMDQLPSVIDPDARYAGIQVGSALAGGVSVGTAGLGASLRAAAAQSGAGAGEALAAAIAAGAAQASGAVTGMVSGPLAAAMEDAAAEAGAPAGDALMAALGAGGAQSAKKTAVKLAEAVSASLDTAMAVTGAAAGDALGAGMVNASGGAAESGSSVVAEFAATGTKAVQALAAGIEEGAPAVAQAAAETGEVAGVGLTEGVRKAMATMSQVTVQAVAEVPEVAAEALAAVPQVAAEEGAAAGTVFGRFLSGAAQGVLAVFAKGPATEALEEVTEAAAEEGASAGTVFGRFFSGAASGVMAVFARGPAVDAGQQAGAAVVAGMQSAVAQEGAGVVAALGEVGEEATEALAGGLKEGEVAVGASVAEIDAMFDSLYRGGRGVSLNLASAFTDAFAGIEADTSAFTEKEMLTWDLFNDSINFEGLETAMARVTARASSLEEQLSAAAAGTDIIAERVSTAGLAMDSVATAADNEAASVATATTSVQGQVAALTELNMAAIQNAELVEDDGAAMEQLGAVADALGVDVGIVVDNLEAGNYSTLAYAASQAKAAVQSNLLAEAQLRLAAAQMTVVQTSQQLGAGLGVDAGAQEAALAGMSSAQSEVTKLSGALGDAGKDSTEAAFGLGSIGSAAEGAGGSVGGMAAVMGGPWAMAAMGVMMVLPQIGSGFKAIQNMFSGNDAVLLDASSLASAIQSDGQAAADSTVSLVAQTAATNGMASSAATAGVSLATWTEAVMGNKTAQDAVTAAVDKANQAQADQAAAAANAGGQTGKYARDLQDARQSAADGAAANNTLSTTYQKVLDTMHAQAGQIVSQINLQNDEAQATAQVDMSTQIFNATLDDNYSKMQLSAQQSAMSSVALLNLGDSQNALNMKLVTAEQAYTEAQQGASGYSTALTALNGSFSTLYGDEASFTGALASLTTSLKTNGDSLNANSAKGYQNAQAAQAVANAAIAAATATYQNAAQTQTSTHAWNQANNYLAQEKDAFEKAAIAAGGNKTAVDQLANALFQLPKNISSSVTVTANTAQAQAALNSLWKQIDNAGATAQNAELNLEHVMASEHHAAGGIVAAAATGGAQYGGPTVMNEQGQEVANLPNGTQVMPAANTASMLAGTGGWGGFGMGPLELRIEWVGGGSNSEIIEWLRENIRIRGGAGPNSVQRALGQVS
jgi:hypothetical protein